MQFPIELSEGVVAVKKGLKVHGTVVPWEKVAEQVRYVPGEPWVFVVDDGPMICVGHKTVIPEHSVVVNALHRSACMLCDSEAEFLILKKCVEPYLKSDARNGGPSKS